MNKPDSPHKHPTRLRILDTAMNVFREKGYTATRVEDVCEAAGVTKGAFFHHFRGKEDLAVETARRWAETTGALFAEAPYHRPEDPLDRVLAYVDFRKALIAGEAPEYSCVAGTLTQEVHATHPAIRDAARDAIFGHADTLVPDIAAAKAKHAPEADFDPESLALFTQAVLQGGFIMAKAKGDPDVARDMVDHLRRYIEMLFADPRS